MTLEEIRLRGEERAKENAKAIRSMILFSLAVGVIVNIGIWILS